MTVSNKANSQQVQERLTRICAKWSLSIEQVRGNHKTGRPFGRDIVMSAAICEFLIETMALPIGVVKEALAVSERAVQRHRRHIRQHLAEKLVPYDSPERKFRSFDGTEVVAEVGRLTGPERGDVRPHRTDIVQTRESAGDFPEVPRWMEETVA